MYSPVVIENDGRGERSYDIYSRLLKELAASNEDFKRDFLMKFVGRVDEKISAQIEKTILKDNVLYLDYQSHSIAVGEMMGSDVLLQIGRAHV